MAKRSTTKRERAKWFKDHGVIDFGSVPMTPEQLREQQHLARRATKVPNRKRVNDRTSVRTNLRLTARDY